MGENRTHPTPWTSRTGEGTYGWLFEAQPALVHVSTCCTMATAHASQLRSCCQSTPIFGFNATCSLQRSQPVTVILKPHGATCSVAVSAVARLGTDETLRVTSQGSRSTYSPRDFIESSFSTA
jgi:hypothetical protein